MSDLPPLPDHASGIQCSAADGIDRTNTDFMRGKIQKLIQQPDFNESGFQLAAGAYSIPWMASTHSNIEMLDRKGEMFASLDTQQIDRKTGKIMGYFPDGERATPVQDDCMKGNIVVLDDNRQDRQILATGTGPEVLLAFAKSTERARWNADRDMDYHVVSFGRSGGVNSNGLARDHARPHGIDLKETFDKHSMLGAPGIGTDISAGHKGRTSFYEGVSPDQFMKDPRYLEHLYNDLQEIHPVRQQERAIEAGKRQTSAQISLEGSPNFQPA